MATKKMDKTAYEPGWGEVILGAVLSIGLGAVLGAVALVLRPVAQVKEMPKEPVAGVNYLIEGSRDSKKATQAAAKRKALVAGQSVTVTEDEINSFLTPLPVIAPPPAAKPKAGEKAPPAKAPPTKAAAPAPGSPAASSDVIALGSANLRIHDGSVQVIVPVTFNVLGLDPHVLVASNGTFVKKGNTHVFEPDTLMVGSCPMQKIPFVKGLLAKTFLTAKDVPEDVAGAWGKLASVAVDGSSLKLTMP